MIRAKMIPRKMPEQTTAPGLEAARENPQGFTLELETICAETCAEYGDPPCWMLPELVQPCEPITPCDECRQKAELLIHSAHCSPQRKA